jgi:hypothetical protein
VLSELPGGTVFPASSSLDSSVILQRHYDDLDTQKYLATQRWVYPPEDVSFPQVSPTGAVGGGDGAPRSLGRGSFGEVFVARWRHVQVACKKLNQAEAETTHTRARANNNINNNNNNNNNNNSDAAGGVLHIGAFVADIKAQKDRAYENRVHLAELEVRVCVCVCVCVCMSLSLSLSLMHSHSHTKTSLPPSPPTHYAYEHHRCSPDCGTQT